MKIARLLTRGVPGLPDVDADLRRAGGAVARLVAITGPSGAGKTRLLQAIVAGKEAVAPYDMTPSIDAWVDASSTSSKIAIGWVLDEAERDDASLAEGDVTSEVVFDRGRPPTTSADPGLIEILKRYAHHDAWGKVDYYPVDRGLPSMASAIGDLELDQVQKRLSRGNAKYGALQRFVADCVAREPERFVELCDLFAELARGRRVLGVDHARRVELDTPTGSTVGLERLSDADRMAFLFAATSTMIRLERSVVLVDTPEIHQAPGEAARYLRTLLARFATSQWIVATTDPDVVAMAEVVVRTGGTP